MESCLYLVPTSSDCHFSVRCLPFLLQQNCICSLDCYNGTDKTIGLQPWWLWYWLDDRGSIAGKRCEAFFFSSSLVQTVSVTHSASCPMETRGSFPGGKAAGRSKLTSHFHPVATFIMRGAILPLPHTSPCRGVYLSTWYVFMALQVYLFKRTNHGEQRKQKNSSKSNCVRQVPKRSLVIKKGLW
jgi:hypothetical protein